MKLIKQNLAKKRSVFFDGTHYHKIWHYSRPEWLAEHFQTVKLLCPELPHDWHHTDSEMTFVMNVIPGTPASQFEHTASFVEQICRACQQNIQQTQPLYHGDWSLSNMIVNQGTVTFIDWDNIDRYSLHEVEQKLISDLHSAFGDTVLNYIG